MILPSPQPLYLLAALHGLAGHDVAQLLFGAQLVVLHLHLVYPLEGVVCSQLELIVASCLPDSYLLFVKVEGFLKYLESIFK